MKRLTQHPQPAMKVADHLKELQKRFFVSAVALVLAGVAVYFFYEPILNLLRSPLGAPLYYSSPAGSFAFVMKICFMGALAVTVPIIVYNLIMFIRPAFEKALPLRRVYLTTIISACLALAGAAFGFVMIIPGALHFFAGFQVDGLSALISADSYLSFVTNVIITFIIVFQLPLLIAFIDTIKPLTPQKLFGMEKWVILGSLVVSFLVPFALDITTSLLIALPIVVLYNVSIAIVLLRHAQKRAQHRKLERAKLDIARIPSSQLSLSNLSFESLTEDGDDARHTITPAQAEPMTQQPAVRPLVTGRASMDIVPRSTRPAPVAPAEWVHKVAAPIPRNERARMISDIAPRRRIAT